MLKDRIYECVLSQRHQSHLHIYAFPLNAFQNFNFTLHLLSFLSRNGYIFIDIFNLNSFKTINRALKHSMILFISYSSFHAPYGMKILKNHQILVSPILQRTAFQIPHIDARMKANWAIVRGQRRSAEPIEKERMGLNDQLLGISRAWRCVSVILNLFFPPLG